MLEFDFAMVCLRLRAGGYADVDAVCADVADVGRAAGERQPEEQVESLCLPSDVRVQKPILVHLYVTGLLHSETGLPICQRVVLTAWPQSNDSKFIDYSCTYVCIYYRDL
jgi:hypothetical protein